MAVVGRHTGSCEWAKGHVCRCTGCGGSLHGWVGGVKLAEPRRQGERSQREREIENRWSVQQNARSGHTAAKSRLCSLDSARFGLTKWMSANWPLLKRSGSSQSAADGNPPGEATVAELLEFAATYADTDGNVGEDAVRNAVVTKAVDALGNAITSSALDAIDALFPPSELPNARRQLTEHFWCDLFVALAENVDTFKDALQSVPEKVADMVVGSHSQSRRPLISRKIVQMAVEEAWAPIQEAIEGPLHLDEVVRSLRILAVLSCPAPDRHPAVRRSALRPLESDLLSAAVRARLNASFPQDAN